MRTLFKLCAARPSAPSTLQRCPPSRLHPAFGTPHAGFYDCNGACIADATCCTDAQAACPTANPNCKCEAQHNSACPTDGGACPCEAGEVLAGNCADESSLRCLADLACTHPMMCWLLCNMS